MSTPAEKEWTLMFYFASDNPLAPSIVSQLKAIKQAGFHQDVNVIAQFDPHPEGTPTHIFDVNLVTKLKNPRVKSRIGFNGYTAGDPFVSNLLEDKLWRDQKDRNGAPIRDQLKASLRRKHNIVYDPPEPPPEREEEKSGKAASGLKGPASNGSKNGAQRELSPKKSLRAFLQFCRDSYPARRYILFILGHGVVVGNDIFLFDENAEEQSLSLKDMGILLNEFKENLNPGAEFELISFHSCSVSSLEVGYELQYKLEEGMQGTANYMLASQGPAFVNSWPYRQILMRVFKNTNDLKKFQVGTESEKVRATIKEMLEDVFDFCFHNSTDFLLAGYSFDLCLSNLNEVMNIKKPLVRLAKALGAGLTDSMVRDFVVLAHWRSQSYWQENYTDINDFCFCLSRQVREFLDSLGAEAETVLGRKYTTLQEILAACEEVMGQLGEIVVRTEFAGPTQQYSRGLSVYFPWSEQLSDRPFLTEYEGYKFEETTWRKFLVDYFDKTMRLSRKTEANESRGRAARAVKLPNEDEELAEDLASLVYNGAGRLSSETSLAPPIGKVNPRDSTGDDCGCPTIKNYPRDTRERRLREQTAPQDVENDKFVPVSEPSKLAFS